MKTDIFQDSWGSVDELIDRLKNETRVLESEKVEQALRSADRKNFLRDGYGVEAYEDYAIPIGDDRSISQPTKVIYMLELLEVEPGQQVLDVGAGSGWTTALLAELVGGSGKVIGLEISEQVAQFGQENVDAHAQDSAEVIKKDAMESPAEAAPFDRILVSASAPQIPDMFTRQLKDGGILVMPIDEKIVRFENKGGSQYDREEYDGFQFPPLEGVK